MKVDPLVATSWEMIFAGLAHSCSCCSPDNSTDATFNHRGVMAVLYLVVFGSWIGYTAYIWLLKHVPTPKVATYAYVNPIVAVFLGWIVLHERFDHFMLAGTIVIVAAVVLVTTAKVHTGDALEASRRRLTRARVGSLKRLYLRFQRTPSFVFSRMIPFSAS